jgi:hypothetical protein
VGVFILPFLHTDALIVTGVATLSVFLFESVLLPAPVVVVPHWGLLGWTERLTALVCGVPAAAWDEGRGRGGGGGA